MPALRAIISASSDPMRRELSIVDAMAKRSGANIKRELEGGGHGGRSGIIRETIVLMREISRGNFTRVPGSLSILLQQSGLLSKVFTDNASAAKVAAQALVQKAAASNLAAIAAKQVVENDLKGIAGLARVTDGEIAALTADKARAAAALQSAEADRVKAVAAIQAAEAMEAEGVAAKFSLTPIGWVTVGIVAIATASYFLVKSFKTLAEQQKNLANLLDTSTTKFVNQADAMKNAAAEAQAFDDWLQKLISSEEGLAEATEATLKMMRERVRFEREAASNSGATKAETDAMELEEMKKELDVVVTAKLQARRKLEDDESAARSANDEKIGFDKENGGKMTTLDTKSKEAAEVLDAVQAAMKEKFITTYAQGQFGAIPMGQRAANKDDKMDVEVGGKKFSRSFNEASANFDAITSESADLAATQKALNDILTQKKELTQKDNEDLKKLTREAGELSGDIALRSEFAGRNQEHPKSHHGSVNSLQAIGAFAAPAVQVDIARHTKETAHNTKVIANHLERIGAAHSSNLGRGRF